MEPTLKKKEEEEDSISHFIQHCDKGYSQYSKTRKTKYVRIGKEKKSHLQYDCLYRNSKESVEKILELIGEFSKIARHKGSIKKLVLCHSKTYIFCSSYW